MIKVKLTKNYTGFEISGTYNDFNELYDALRTFIEGKENTTFMQEDMDNYILGFLYDLRHAYQGDRHVYTTSNGLTDEVKEFYGIKKSVQENVYFSFEYLLTDLFVDAFLFKRLVQKRNRKIELFDIQYGIVSSFFGKVLQSLKEIISEVQLEEIQQLLIDYNINDKSFYHQWYSLIAFEYIKMSKTRHKKELLAVLEALVNPYQMPEYKKFVKDINQFAKEQNCLTSFVQLEDYPEEIKW